MTLIGWTQILLFCFIIAALARPLGGWLTRVLDGEVRALAAIERPIWRLTNADPDEEQSWLGYALALITSISPASSRSTHSSGCKARCRSTPRE